MSYPASPSEQHPSDHSAIATAVFNALVQIQVKRPEWIQERYRSVSLIDQREKVIQFVKTHIDKQTEPNAQEGVAQFLRKILEPNVFQTQFYDQLMASVLAKAKLAPEPAASPNNQPLAPAIPQSNGKTSLQSLNLANVAILLLDAENMDLPEIAEQWLGQFCHHPITLKFAFGDWKKLGNRDKDLHQRGYHLIHVPNGKNHADSKMTVIGSSILVHLPIIKEAVVCSNDNDLQDLRNTLHFQGLSVSWLQRHEQTLTLIHYQTKESATFQLPPPPKVPSKNEGIAFLKEYLTAQTNHQTYFNQLTLEFSRNFKIPMTTFVKKHLLATTPKAFLQKSSDFKVFTEEDDPQLYVALQSDRATSQPQELNLEKVKSMTIEIAQQLLREQNIEAISVSSVASAFHKQHKQAMTSVLKKLGIGKKIPVFLQSCNGIKIKKVDSQWVVMLDK